MNPLKYLLEKEKHDLNDEIPEEFKDEVGKICSEYLTGEWEKVDKNSISIQRISGGNSNHVFKVSISNKNENPVLLRIYGTECEEEIFKDTLLFSILSEKKLGPKFLGYFPGGRLEEFIESRSLVTRELAYPSVLKILARKLAGIHSLEVPLSKRPQIFDMIRSELKKIEDATTPNYLIKIKTTKLCNLKYPEGVTIQELEKEVRLLEDYVKRYNIKIVFSHNDIFEGNIIVRNNATIEKDKIISDDENDCIIVIDYEYSCYNYRGFDFSQIFREMAYSYDSSFEHGYQIYQEHLKNDEKLLVFINEYLKEMFKINNIVIDEEKLKKETSQLLFESKIFFQVVDLYWGIWNIRQGFISTIKSYNFMLHGLDRLALFYDNKQHELLNGDSF
uniref:Choline/ethanolamine kinase n=1 Tax=Strongyloides papillosus TaxID=174720 RepID=A0A0N5BGC8_STREA